ncbi:putative RNA polymerase II subunit A C-terminal domain phosphatase [Seiridium unicorne]|uniref:RNA polymerase II subunit A C-terminal domain phosphatase n=1 Tax=Seiridium unicorne TaxID=138068 RepID=A0ABR2US32_9PEZI
MVNLREFNTGLRLRYPITISRIHKKRGDKVKRQEAVVQYTYKFKRTIGDPNLGEEREIEETGYGDWDCPSDGTVHKWHVGEGDVVTRDQLLVVIDEPCSHDTQFAGLCTKCGKDMTESNWAAEGLDIDRATISMVHDNVALKVSATEAEKKELELQERLLTQRKLSLVVDLDQTIIHACVEPTIGEWQHDPTNPNYDSVKEVRSFQLDDGPKHDDSPKCSYYIKLRPGLAGFLERISELYEMHVYTMGTRAYAQEIAKIVDPEMKYFGNRIISRDENGSLAAKRLQRLFPVSTHMVVVIDDRADVWPLNRSNLIKVTPYDFFRGIGDINSSFLPKRDDIIAPAPTPVPLPTNGDVSRSPNAPGHANNIPEHERAVAESDDDNALLQLQAQEQERELEKQLTERPLLHLQEKLDKGESESDPTPSTEVSEAPEQNGHTDSPSHRHNLLRDDDEELAYLENHLALLHQNFYTQHDSRVSALRKETGIDEITADSIPDVGKLLEWVKKRVLRGCSIVLSGLVPLGIDVERSEIGLQIQSFGGEIRTRISRSVTHLVISSSRPRTQKVRQAARIPSIKIVNQDWLAGSLAQWKQLDVDPFLVEVHPADRVSHTPIEASGRDSESASPQPVDEPDHADDEDEEGVDESGGDDGADDDDDTEVQDVYGVMPTEPEDGERSPVDDLKNMDWGELDAEFNEFMGSDAGTDSDGQSEFDDTASTTKTRKRKVDDDEDGDEGSILAKKQKLARDRTTGLRNVKNAGEEGSGEGSGLPTPMGTGDEEDAAAGEDEEDFDLEAQLEAELAAEADAEAG